MCAFIFPAPPLSGDEIRRVTLETVFPFLKQLFAKKRKEIPLPDTILAEYDKFDDYLEMVIQFGVSIMYKYVG